MRRAGDVLGLAVIDVTSGKKLGQVDDLLFDREGRLHGLSLSRTSWFEKKIYLPLDHILSIGEDCVTLKGPLPDKLPLPKEEWFRYSRGEQQMLGRPVITTNGKQLGILEEVYFDEKQGNIVGYELSDGFMNDMMDGRQLICQPDQFLFGQDAFVVQSPVDPEPM